MPKVFFPSNKTTTLRILKTLVYLNLRELSTDGRMMLQYLKLHINCGVYMQEKFS